ncbi:MAG: DUF2779 domain-containing protein [Halobacteriovoraceae bacterium]|nr:DUF2779 domain-containing protein [Halobacteriovoraceae bacterium]
MAKIKHLSKTQLQAGQKCPKLLYFKKFHYNDLPSPDLESQERFDQGNTVGELAVRYFSQICDSRYGKDKHIYIDKKPWEKDDAIIETEEAIENGYRMIFEGASESDKDGVWAKNDIVEILDDGSINLYEVKATKSTPGAYHFNDASIQYNAFNGAGYKINKIFLVTVNPDFIRDTTFNFHEYFIITDVTKKVVKIAKDSCDEVPSLLEMINSGKIPEIEIGSHCLKGFTCDAYSICWGDKSGYGVSKLLSRQWRLRNKFIDQGKILIEDLTAEDAKEFDPVIKIDYDVYKTKEPQINKNGLKVFLNQLRYPVYYLDYETINSIIPPFVGTIPGEQIPFQFSLHIQRSDDFNKLEHFEFLHCLKNLEMVRNYQMSLDQKNFLQSPCFGR